MALPVVRSLIECAEYNNTVSPYIYQLQPLPQVFLQSATNIAALKQIYLDTNPLISAIAFSIAISPIFLVVSEINKNYSQVDRVWSILPTIYNIHYAVYAHLAGIETTRLDLVAVISAIWSTRLTYNYYRKGGYSIGSEDYRWAIVKKQVGPGVFFLFNIIFISLAQSLLLASVTTPSYVLLLTSRLATYNSSVSSFSLEDVVASAMMLSAIATSFIADQQQWNYQNAKSAYRQNAKVPAGYEQEDLDRGFLTKGLFAYSRHPNFAAEQTVWVVLYLWSCLATGTWYNWTGLGAASYLILFQSSTWLTELLSAQKYPEYKLYQRKVGKFLPSLGSGGPIFPEHQTKHAVGNSTMEVDASQARQRYDLR
ncbi:hypothetical protein LTR99_002784 [Exophiala xenobiotica]|uniref:Steroid 5-alpha reductase C-terminal domain-containing protein n=1 Tax=Vermiconidia calcicola TaxID=1690605 RepID=A0AAV9QBD5_9PEZI|nr:hypothetical protein H2202_009151 [Exophiala xenobiotica]KAK5535404.1 hypothetical protein LTR23_008426 [Chaetothyriales sp. CCFEE 6169]KAK5538454.1 hypothetical protein LTR25_003996 [Vermiconidia calcicola]KAK5194282.1 hypothetical protein LTR92_005524 [Exophiala xenobiotica]KAK5264184.1 hypothetical protein LTR96_010455 [Exophiala xenobiotica]